MYVKNGRIGTKGFSDMTETDVQDLYSLNDLGSVLGQFNLKQGV
jgi:hypothetical protein